MPIKYGKNIRPWECVITFPNTQGSNTGQFINLEDKVLEYGYRRNNDSRQSHDQERQPKRKLII